MSSASLTPHAGQPGDKQTITKVVGASLAGTTLEWYDHFIYG